MTCPAARGGCLRPRPGRARRRPRGRPGRASAGWWCRRRWCARARAARSRAAIRASVWASTALVGSTSTSTGGSASSARASRSRCCWPPENSRPRSATIVSSPSGSAVERSPRRWPPAAPPRSARPRSTRGPASSSRSAAGEEPGVVVGHQDQLADDVAGQIAQRYAVEAGQRCRCSGRAGRRWPRRPRAGGRDRGEPARTGDQPGVGVDEVGGGRVGRGRRRRRLARVRGQRQHPHHPAGRDVTAGELLYGLGERAQREEQEGGVPVEGDELRHRDRARAARTGPRARSRGPRRCRAAAPGPPPARTPPARPGRPAARTRWDSAR